MAGRPSACLVRIPFADEMATGRPAKLLMGSEGSLMEMTGSAPASFGRVKPAAAAAPAPRKSRRVGDTMTPEWAVGSGKLSGPLSTPHFPIFGNRSVVRGEQG